MENVMYHIAQPGFGNDINYNNIIEKAEMTRDKIPIPVPVPVPCNSDCRVEMIAACFYFSGEYGEGVWGGISGVDGGVWGMGNREYGGWGRMKSMRVDEVDEVEWGMAVSLTLCRISCILYSLS